MLTTNLPIEYADSCQVKTLAIGKLSGESENKSHPPVDHPGMDLCSLPHGDQRLTRRLHMAWKADYAERSIYGRTVIACHHWSDQMVLVTDNWHLVLVKYDAYLHKQSIAGAVDSVDPSPGNLKEQTPVCKSSIDYWISHKLVSEGNTCQLFTQKKKQ